MLDADLDAGVVFLDRNSEGKWRFRGKKVLVSLFVFYCTVRTTTITIFFLFFAIVGVLLVVVVLFDGRSVGWFAISNWSTLYCAAEVQAAREHQSDIQWLGWRIMAIYSATTKVVWSRRVGVVLNELLSGCVVGGGGGGVEWLLYTYIFMVINMYLLQNM